MLKLLSSLFIVLSLYTSVSYASYICECIDQKRTQTDGSDAQNQISFTTSDEAACQAMGGTGSSNIIYLNDVLNAQSKCQINGQTYDCSASLGKIHVYDCH